MNMCIPDICNASGAEQSSASDPSFRPEFLAHGILAVAMQELGCAAGAIIFNDPHGLTAGPRVLANLRYDGRVINNLVQDFEQVEQQFPQLQQGRPLTWEDLPAFIDTPLAQESLIPSGYSEGSSTNLHDKAGYRIGRLHVSFIDPTVSTRVRDRLGILSGHAAALLIAELTRQRILRNLTQRELQVLEGVSAGQSNNQIAKELSISSRTVAAHVASILAKTGSTTRTDISVKAVRLGII